MTALAYTLNRKITIERPTTIPGDFGPQPGAWEPVASRIWAEVQDAMPSRTEAARNGLRIAAQQARIRIRNRAGITSDMRIVLHGPTDKVYQIVGGPAEIHGRVLLEMLCEAYSS